MTKRGNNEGSIYKRGSDGRYAASISLADGKRRSFYGKTRREVAEKLQVAQRSLADGLPIPGGRLTVEQYLTQWVEGIRPTVRPNTHAGYERSIRLHTLPYIGRRRLAQLGPQDLQTLYQALLDKGLSPRSVQLTHVIIHRALRQAERWGLIAANPARLVDAPRPSRKEIQPLLPEEIKTLLRAANDDPLEALYFVALTTGMRQGEILGTRWADIDLKRAQLHVRQQAQRTSAGWTFVPPKTAKGRRSITLPVAAVESLRRHRIAQNERRLARGPLWENFDSVFTNKLGRPIERQNLVRRSFHPLLERAGLRRIRFHDLRHSAATLLLSENVHPKIVSERLGHANISITLDVYSHVLSSLQKDAATRIDRFLSAN